MMISAHEARGDPVAVAMARTLVVMSLVGAGLSALSLLADLTPDRYRGLELVLTAIGMAFAAALFVGRHHTTPLFYAVIAVPCATVQLSLGLHLSGDSGNPAAVFYVLVALYSFYFFSRRVATANLIFAAASYALALAPITTASMGLDRWMFAFGAATVAGVVVSGLRDRLVNQAGTDWLTDLPNRRGFHERLERELSRVRRERGPLTLVLADVDYFKAVNDLSGHEAGDRALRRVAEVLGATVRAHDLVARVGGDEFGLLLVGSDERAARELAERVLGALRDSGLTMSFGTAVAPRHGNEAGDLMRAADTALYAAKDAGRGQLAVAPDAADLG